ncbi:MAG TPA: GxxExxY protein [Lunatimonas sp.]|nr:GxxExxY protein [Lunatimonas sp.]
MKIDELKHSDLTNGIIKAFYKVYNALGYGFLEKVYENALFIELVNNQYVVEKQSKILVSYEGVNVGNYYADLLVENKVIIEVKASSSLSHEHEAQLINYLRATKIEVGLLLNFGKSPNFRRKIYFNGEILDPDIVI